MFSLDLIYIINEVLAFISHPASLQHNGCADLPITAILSFRKRQFQIIWKNYRRQLFSLISFIFKMFPWRHENEKYLYSFKLSYRNAESAVKYVVMSRSRPRVKSVSFKVYPTSYDQRGINILHHIRGKTFIFRTFI